MKKLTKHIFVCINEREKDHRRGSCHNSVTKTGEGGGYEVHQRFKALLKEKNLAAEVRANKAGCLDVCEHGPVVVVYPEAVWYSGVQPSDVDEIVQAHIIEGQPVERLRMKGK